jgi:hypothetical protein
MYQALQTIKDRLQANLGNKIKYYFFDDPKLINTSSLPCIAIVPVRTDISVLDTGRDAFEYTIDIYLIINALSELGKYSQEMIGIQFLTQLMEEIDTSTWNLKSNTILDSFRKDLELADNLSISNVAGIDYTVRLRSEQMVTLESHCRITVTRIIVR